MATPIPLTRRISDLALDALVVAEDVQCPERRETLTTTLRRINGKADLAYQAEKVGDAIRKSGHVSAWTRRGLSELESQAERVGRLEDIEHGPKPRSLKAG